MSRVVRLETFIQFIASEQSDVSINSRFRRSNVSEIRSLNFSSQTSSYFLIINSDSESDTSRQLIIESETIDSEHSVENTQFDNSQTNNNQTSSSINTNQIEEIRRSMSSTESLFEVDQIF